jgi:hypothetical protein
LRGNWRSSCCWNVFLNVRMRNFWELSSHPNEAAAKYNSDNYENHNVSTGLWHRSKD